MKRGVPPSVVDAWERYFRSVHPMKGRDYAIGFRAGRDRKRLRRIAYVDLDHFLEIAQSDWKRHGQYLSIHDFEHKLYAPETGQYMGIYYHDESEKDVKPSFLAHLYIDIEPKQGGVDSKQTFDTLTSLLSGVGDRLGAVPLVMQTRRGRYGVVYVLPRIDLGSVDYAYAKELYRELWLSVLDIAGLRDRINITVDPQVKDLVRVTRVPYTFHEITEEMIVPVEVRDGRVVFVKARDFDMGHLVPIPRGFIDEVAKRVEEEIRKRLEMARQIREELVRRRMERVFDYDSIDALGYFLDVFARSRPLRWREVVAPDIGRVRYHPKLEGWGWIRTLVRDRIPIPDARMTFCWLTLPWAVKRGLVTEAEARDYLMYTVSFFPDKDFDEYWSKYEENRKYDYTAPVWRSMVTMTRKDGAPISDYNEHLRAAVLAALYWAGLIDIERPEVLGELLGFEIEHGLKGRGRKREGSG